MRLVRSIVVLMLVALVLPLVTARPLVRAQDAPLTSCEPAAPATPVTGSPVTSAPFTPPAPAEAQLTKVTLGYVPVMVFAPAYVAKELGFFAEQGLDVELQSFAGGSEMITQAAAGRLDAGMGGLGPGLWNAVERGLPLKVIAPGHGEGNPVATPLMVAKSKCESGEIRSVADLRGKKVAINAPGATEYWLKQALAQGGLTIDDVDLETMPFADAVTALGGGAIDAALLGEPTATQAERLGFAVRLSTNFPVQGITVTGLFANTDFLANNPDVATGLVTGYLKAIREIMQRGYGDPAILPIVAQYTQLPEDLIAAAVAPVFPVDGEINVEGLATLQAFFRERGQLEYDTDLDPETILDRTFVNRALDALGPAAS